MFSQYNRWPVLRCIRYMGVDDNKQGCLKRLSPAHLVGYVYLIMDSVIWWIMIRAWDVYTWCARDISMWIACNGCEFHLLLYLSKSLRQRDVCVMMWWCEMYEIYYMYVWLERDVCMFRAMNAWSVYVCACDIKVTSLWCACDLHV